MSAVVLRLVYLPIYVDSADPTRCKEESSDPRQDGCPSFLRDDDGDPFCGAYREYLKTADGEEDHDGQALYRRADRCLSAQVQPEAP